jgi:hypothetical protein
MHEYSIIYFFLFWGKQMELGVCFLSGCDALSLIVF